MKNFLEKHFFLILIFSVILAFSGCKRNVGNKLVGKWELVYFDKDIPPYTNGYESYHGVSMKIQKFIFEFDSGDKMTRTLILKKPNGADTTVTEVGFYYIQRPKTQVQVKITKLPLLQGLSHNGVWFIDKVNSQVLMLQKIKNEDLSGGAYIRFEFLRK